ncbi:protein AKNAD1 isoform X2 [Phasianus colchicus]|uniref:protein AKNAD1 isoform X2 n=1 Tax=Phasianus colchicus TaxID=9054 RepID=UPI00129DA8BE|nr:protein AKNAD1 isoform X2 [Phasianus colchicus]
METQMSCSIHTERRCVTDTTDAEQDDPPCDGDGGRGCEYHGKSEQVSECTCSTDALNLSLSEDNRNASGNHEIHVQPEGVFSYAKGTIGTIGISGGIPGSEVSFKKALPAGGGQPDGKDPPSRSNMSHVLLRHFPTGELTGTWQLIEHETIPETSLTESIDETTNKHTACNCVRGPSTGEQQAAKFEEHHLEKLKAVNIGGKIQNLLNKNTKTSTSALAKRGCRQENFLLINEHDDACIFQNTEQTYVFKKSVPSHELIEGQGEAQKCQEDNNEVTSEMKVPKMSENNKSIPTIKRSSSFPTLLSKSVTINSILENQKCFDSIKVTNQEETSIPESSQQQKILPQSSSPNAGFATYSGDIGTAPKAYTADTSVVQPTHGLSEPRLPCGTTASAFPATHTVELCCLNASNLLPEITQGEKMSQILKEQTDQLKIKVEDFSKHMTEETFLLQDDYLALDQLKRYLEALERNYLTAREEHRNLQLQYYKDKTINIGEFDPKRKVEGEIFRLGTLLEDIQEQADDSKHKWAPSSSSCGSAHSSYSLWESSVLSSIADSPEENAFLPKNNEGENTSQTSSIIPQRNAHFSLECDRCNLRIHTLQKRAESTYGKEMDPLGKSCLLASKYSSNEMRFFSPEGKYDAEGLGFHTQGTLSQKDSASEESMKGNNIMERKTGTRTIFILRKPTDLSDKNLRFKCRCSRESQNPFKLRNYKESVQSCTPHRNKNSGSTSYSQKKIPSQKTQTNQQPPEPVNRLSESKKSARNASAINIRNRTAKDFNINILNSTLDHAIQTANSLKKATEKMVQAISEDLTKARRKQL